VVDSLRKENNDLRERVTRLESIASAGRLVSEGGLK